MLPIQRKISQYNHYKGNDIKYIVLHYVGATGTAKNNADYFYGGDRQASAHYFVDDNEIWQSVEEFNGSWSVGNTKTEVNNRNSINIEMCCPNPQLFVTDTTIQNTCELVAYLMKKHNIPISNIRSHYEVSGYSKLCPNFANTSRWSDLKNKIQIEYNKLNNEQTPISEPTTTSKPQQTTSRKYLFLKGHMTKWNVYPINVAPVVGNECGYLNPSLFGGIEYEILGNPQTDVYTIQTRDYGKVNIYVPVDGDSEFYNKNTTVAQPKPLTPKPSNKKYLNLKPHVATWRVYPTNVAPVIKNSCGMLAPKTYGGLSYEILANPQTDVYTIQTSSFGKVNIYAPRDNDSSITQNPIY